MTIFRSIFVLLVALPVLVAAQQDSPCEDHFSANVVDAHGQQILGLTTDQFHAKVQGQPVKVTSAKFETGPQRILLLLDVSGSMSDDPQQWELAKLVAGDILSAGPPQAELALATFSSKVEASVRFGQRREAVREAIANLKPTAKITPVGHAAIGETALNDAILEASNMFGSSQLGDVVYAITDGFDNKSKSSTTKVRRYLEQRSIRLFASVIHNSHSMPLSGQADGPEIVGTTAKETGGYYLVLETGEPSKVIDNAKRAVHQLYDLMASFYLLKIELPREPNKARELKLTVVNAKGDKKKGTIVFHPQKLFSCASRR